MKTQRVRLHVRKDMTTTLNVDAYAHEIPLYEEGNPEGTITVLSKGPVVTLDDAEEFERLMQKFGATEEGTPIPEAVYGRGGMNLRGGNFVMDGNAAQAPVKQGSADDEPEKLDVEQLRSLFEAAGIEYKRTMNAPTLAKLLREETDKARAKLEEMGMDHEGLDIVEMRGLIEDMSDAA